MPPISWSRRWNGAPHGGLLDSKHLEVQPHHLLPQLHQPRRRALFHARDRRAVVVAVASVAADALELEEVGLAEEEVRDDPLLLAGASRQVIIGPTHVRLPESARSR